MTTIQKTISFKSVKYGNEKAIRISFGLDQVFILKEKGSDLDIFDELLLNAVPDIDFDKLSPCIVRDFEGKLFNMFMKQHKHKKSLASAFSNFISLVKCDFCKESEHTSCQELGNNAKSIINNVIQTIKEKIFLVKDEVSNKKSIKICTQKRLAIV